MIKALSLRKQGVGDLLVSNFENLNVGSTIKYGRVSQYFPREERGVPSESHVYASKVSFEDTSLVLRMEDVEEVLVFRKAPGTTALTFIPAAATALGLAVIAVGIAQVGCGCPHAYATAGDSTVFQGSLFPGAILKSLEREDYLVCSTIGDGVNAIDLTIANELNEIQYIDHLDLLEVDKNGFQHLCLNDERQLQYYSDLLYPKKAKTPSGYDVLEPLSKRDAQSYEFIDSKSFDDFAAVELTFNRRDVKDNALLVVKGRQTDWLNDMAKVGFGQLGKDYRKVMDKWDTKGNIKRNTSKSKKRGVSLTASIRNNGEWKEIGTYHYAGTTLDRELSIPLDLSGVSGNEIEVKLECAHKIWELDFAGVTDNWSDEVKSKPVKLTSAIASNGESSVANISSSDGKYEVLKAKGGSINLKYAQTNNNDAFYVIKSEGYYRDQTEFTNERNNKMLRQYRKKGTVNAISKILDYGKSTTVTR